MLKAINQISKSVVSGLIKDQLDISNKDSVMLYNPLLQIEQKRLYNHYRQNINSPDKLNLQDVGFRVTSQFDEDGILLYIFSQIGMGKRIFVDIGSSDGINSNCANLVMNFGWHGLFVDGNEQAIRRGEMFYSNHPNTWLYPPKFACEIVQRENINQIIKLNGFSGQIELLSIDVDGNDYWLWDALKQVKPKVVIIETHIEFGLRSIVVPYDKDYSYPGKHPQYHGASIVAMDKLAHKKGYTLVGSNLYGFNTIYVRTDLIKNKLPKITPKQILESHPRNKEREELFEEIKHYDYLKV